MQFQTLFKDLTIHTSGIFVWKVTLEILVQKYVSYLNTNFSVSLFQNGDDQDGGNVLLW